MLKIIDLHRYYGNSHVLQGVNIQVEQGTVAAVVGRNGVGKTALCRSIVGFTPVRAGRVVFNGDDITNLASHTIASRRISLVPQGRRIFASLTVQENLAIASQPSPSAGAWTMEKIFSVFPRLAERGRHRGDELSGGAQQMLAIRRALVPHPILPLVDGPSAEVAPGLVARVGRLVPRRKGGTTSILLVEQNAAFAVQVSDIAYVMSKGTIVHSSDPRALWRNEEIKTQFLGVPPPRTLRRD